LVAKRHLTLKYVLTTMPSDIAKSICENSGINFEKSMKALDEICYETRSLNYIQHGEFELEGEDQAND
jgi:hypothetical protein